MRSRNTKTKRVTKDSYTLSIKLHRQLVEKINEESKTQFRTAASLIRQTLAEKFQKESV